MLFTNLVHKIGSIHGTLQETKVVQSDQKNRFDISLQEELVKKHMWNQNSK